MQQKLFFCRWVHGQHRASEVPNVRAAFRRGAEDWRDSASAKGCVRVGVSAEDLGNVVVNEREFHDAAVAFDGAHQQPWNHGGDHQRESMRHWQAVCAKFPNQ